MLDRYSRNGFLTKAGYALVAQRSLEGFEAVDMETHQLYLDLPVSVSGLRRDETVMIWNEELLDEQHRRFLPSVEGQLS